MRTRTGSRRPPTLVGVAALVAALTGTSTAGDVDHLYGTVYTAHRVPLRDAVVMIHTASGTSLRTQTDRNGRYSAVGTFDGAITIDVSHAGYYPDERYCVLAPGDSARADFSIASVPRTLSNPVLARSTGTTEAYGVVEVYEPSTGRRYKLPALQRTCAVDPQTVDRTNLR